MVAVMTGVGILWIPVVQNVQGGQLFLYIQQVQLYFCPPIASVYLIAILWDKVTEKVSIGKINGYLYFVRSFNKKYKLLTNTLNPLYAINHAWSSVRVALARTENLVF